MNRVTRFFLPGIFLWMIFVLFVAEAARADGISFQLSSASLNVAAGGTATFMGTITNNSGQDFNATDFFFNFGNFDFTVLTPNQLFGTGTDFSIPNGSTTTVMDLFNVQLAAVLTGSTFLMDVQLEDSNLDLSAVQTVAVDLRGSVNIPEPSTLLLLGLSLLAIPVLRYKCSAQLRGISNT